MSSKKSTFTYTYAKKTIKYSNEWVDGKWYNKDGTQTYKPRGSWHKNSKGTWYVDEKGWFPKNRWQKIDGKWYFFDKYGKMETNAYRQGWWLGKLCAWSDPVHYSWHKSDGNWWYGAVGGWYAKNPAYTYIIDGVSCNFNKNGFYIEK